MQPGDALLNIDPQLLQEAIIELFANAFRHDAATVRLPEARIDKNRFLFTLREPKVYFELSTENWGQKPLEKSVTAIMDLA